MPRLDPALTKLANDVRLTAMQLSRRVRFESDAAVPPHQFTVLAKVAQAPRTPGELAELERVSAPSMTRTVAALVEAGYLDRVPCATDGRQRILTLTAAGKLLVDQTIHDRDDWMVARLADLPQADRDTLARTVEILNRVLTDG